MYRHWWYKLKKVWLKHEILNIYWTWYVPRRKWYWICSKVHNNPLFLFHICWFYSFIKIYIYNIFFYYYYYHYYYYYYFHLLFIILLYPIPKDQVNPAHQMSYSVKGGWMTLQSLVHALEFVRSTVEYINDWTLLRYHTLTKHDLCYRLIFTSINAT